MAGELRYHPVSGNLVYSDSGNLVYDCGPADCPGTCTNGVMPDSRIATIAGVLAGACNCSGVNGSFVLTGDPPGAGGCTLTYHTENFCDTQYLDISLTFFDGEVLLDVSIGALTGSVTFRKAAPASPYNCTTEGLGAYTKISETSSQCNFGGMTVTISVPP